MQRIDWSAIRSPIIFAGDTATAYRDPAAIYHDGLLRLFFTLVRTENDGNPYQVEHDVLQASIRAGNPINEGENGALSTLTAILGRMATYSGHIVTWEDAMKSETDLGPDRYSWDAAPPILPGPNGLYACAMPGQKGPY